MILKCSLSDTVIPTKNKYRYLGLLIWWLFHDTKQPNKVLCFSGKIFGAFMTLNRYQWQMEKINFRDGKSSHRKLSQFQVCLYELTVLESERKYHWHKGFVAIDGIQIKYSSIFKPHTTAILRCA